MENDHGREGNPNQHLCRRKKINCGVDSFSSLPNEILHRILRFIPTKLAIRTSVLSKRWRYVWCETPCLLFDWSDSSSAWTSSSTSKTLANYRYFHNSRCRRRSHLKIISGVDSFSSLPDELIHQILSFIPTKYAIRTLALSKRWRTVWCETPCLNFHHLHSSVESIRKTLASYSPAKITSFRLRTGVGSERRARRANSLLEYAVSHNVENISFEVYCTENYRFLECFFSNSSLKQLSVGLGCELSPSCTVSWTSLRSLSLTDIKLSAESFVKILSGSPMLESLTLSSTFSLDYLDLSKSVRLRRLDIELSHWNWKSMRIVAPHIYSLRLRNISFRKSQRNYALVDVSSLTEANIDCDNKWYETHHLEFVGVQAMVEKLQNVENLTLGYSFLQDKCVTTYLDMLMNSNQCWRQLKDVVFPSAWDSKVAKPKLVGSFVELLLAKTRTLETLVLRLGSFKISRLRKLSRLTRTLSCDKKVSIVIN